MSKQLHTLTEENSKLIKSYECLKIKTSELEKLLNDEQNARQHIQNSENSHQKSYIDFDWDNSKEWLEFEKEIFPKPKGLVLEKFKNLWYQENISNNTEY